MTRRGAMLALVLMGAGQEQFVTLPRDRLLTLKRLKTVMLTVGGPDGIERFIVEAPGKHLEFTADEILAAFEKA
jgi:hypothetical protein